MESIVEKMLICRRFDEEIVARYPKQFMRSPTHLSIGQEAVAVGVCHHLRKEDSVFSTHRNHAHYIAKGGDINKFALELHGKIGGCNGGRGGSMHALDKSVNFFSCPIVASAIPLAVGAAFANKIDGNGNITICFFGDAAVEEGVFHESMNFASLMRLPIIFVCEDNSYSVDTPIKKRQPNRNIIELGKAHNIHSLNIGSNNVFEIAETFSGEISYVREHNKPMFIVAKTKRSHVHCGITKEFEIEVDPLDIAIKKINPIKLNEMEEYTQIAINRAFDSAEAAALPTLDMANQYVYA